MNLVFIIQRGELELKGLLLAWSLRRLYGRTLGLYAACPDYADWSDLDPDTRAALDALQVTLCPFEPQFAPRYPIGNKLSVLQLLPPGQPGMFADSDLLALDKGALDSLLASAECAAKPADAATWGCDERWRQVYALAGQPAPTRRVRLTVSGHLALPYFNAGLVVARDPQGLGEHWLNIARVLDDSDLELGQRYPWLDQIALPPAFAASGRWQALSEAWNYPAHLRPLGGQSVHLCHYHHPGVILREPRLLTLFRQACRELPHLASLAQLQPAWQPLLTCSGAPNLRRGARRDFLITGIPRSGTSYVCQLLHEAKNWVVVNEPVELFELLEQRPDASGLGLMHRQWRESLYRGEPIMNKVSNDGRVISDTAHNDQRQPYRPVLQTHDFWLGSKNTLAYMAALSRIRQLGWPVLASVRHPLDTLASWRGTFSHLREAQVADFPVANPRFGGWSGEQREALNEIAAQGDASLRRVLLWRLLARTLLDNDWLTLWRYEDLCADPAGHVRSFMRQLGARERLKGLHARERRRSSEQDALDRELLGDLCGPELMELDYDL